MIMEERKRYKIECELVQRLESALGEEYACSPDPTLPVDNISTDIVIGYKHSVMIAVGVYTETDCFDKKSGYLQDVLLRTRCAVGFLFDENFKYKFFVNENCSIRIYPDVTFKDIIDVIKNKSESIIVEPDKNKVRQIIFDVCEKSPCFATKDECTALLKSFCNDFEYSFGSISLPEKLENEFMLSLLGTIDCAHLWRYTSLRSFFESLKDECHIMCCPISMNDAREGTYADSKMPWFRNYVKDEDYYNRKNNIFMLSCCDCQGKVEENLSMWRLYGDDSKGVCVKYAVDYEKIDNYQMYLAHVNYAHAIDAHPELEFLACLQNTAIENNWYFTLNKWHLWKYFFKPNEYAIENEVRLVFDHNHLDEDVFNPEIKWYMDKDNCIISRLAKFPTDQYPQCNFPLKISEIILGPNMPNADTNLEQIDYMVYNTISGANIDFVVRKSQIDNYRK